MDRNDGARTSPAPSTTIDVDKPTIKLPSFSSLFASIQTQPPPTKTGPTPLSQRSDWNGVNDGLDHDYSSSAPTSSPWLTNKQTNNHSTNDTHPTPPLPTVQQQNIRLPPIHLVSPSGGYLHPLPSGLVGGPGANNSRGQRSPPSHRKRSNSLTGHPYAYAPSSRSTYEPPPVVSDLGRRPSLGNFGGGPPQPPTQVGPSGLSRRARMQSRSPPREYPASSSRGRQPSPPRVVDYGVQQRGRAGSPSEEHRAGQSWDREGRSQRAGGSPSYPASALPGNGAGYSDHHARPDTSSGYYPSRSNNVASDLSALHISQADSWRPHSSQAPLPSMSTAPPAYPHPPRSQPHPPSQPHSRAAPAADPAPPRSSQGWPAQPPPAPRTAYPAADANPHAVPVGASAPPEVGRYACPHCPKRFARPSSLRIHIHSHTGEKPFACQHCHRGFSVQSNLRRHLKIHRTSGLATAEESEGGGSLSDEEGSEEAMEIVG